MKFRDRKIYFYILIEFQSTVDRYMALRILNYITLFYLDLLKVEKELEKLPVVFPIVLYNGGRNWTAPLDFSELIDSPFASTKPYIPHFKYYMIAEKDIPEEELIALNNPVSAAFLVDTSDAAELRENLEKRRELARILLKMLAGVSDKELKKEFIIWINRMLHRKKVSIDISSASEEEVTHMLMESIEKLKKEGRLEGRLEGKLEGRLEGKLEGKLEAARNMKNLGYDIEAIMKVTGLTKAEVEKL